MADGFQNRHAMLHAIPRMPDGKGQRSKLWPANLIKTMSEQKSYKKEILEKKLVLRRQLWPEIKDADLWTHRRKDGFVPIPRVMPLVLRIMNDLALRPVASTYLDLWCRKFEEQFVTLNKPLKEYAFFAGFPGQRGEQTWKERMRELAKLGFIKIESGSHGEFSYVLIMNPLIVIELLAAKKTPSLRKEYLNTLRDRSNAVKAKDLDSPST
jgi:hypothetical protein